jgi:hypothetical protein
VEPAHDGNRRTVAAHGVIGIERDESLHLPLMLSNKEKQKGGIVIHSSFVELPPDTQP